MYFFVKIERSRLIGLIGYFKSAFAVAYNNSLIIYRLCTALTSNLELNIEPNLYLFLRTIN